MTEEDYYALVMRMGFHSTKVPTIWRNSNGDIHYVQLASEKTPEERRAYINKMKFMLDIDW